MIKTILLSVIISLKLYAFYDNDFDGVDDSIDKCFQLSHIKSN